MIDDLQLRHLAAGQHGLVTAEQLTQLGITAQRRARLVDGRRWERLTQQVVRLVGSCDTPGQRAMFGVLDAGPGGALRGASACAWWGVPGNQLEPVDVAHLRSRAHHPAAVGRVRNPVLLPPHHVVTLDGVPTVVPARALFDVAGSKRGGAKLPYWFERMERMVDTAWSKRLVSGATMHDMLDELAQRGRPGIQVMRAVLAKRGRDYIPPASGLESRVVQILERASLPPLRRQVETGSGIAWIGRVDFRDTTVPFVLEIQSERFHSSLVDQQLDGQRRARLEAAGFVVAEATEVDVWHRPHVVVQKVADGRREAQGTQARRRSR